MLLLGNKRSVLSSGLSLAGKIKKLFAAGQNGAWYDFGQLSQEYQDSAGTVPVTAVEQPLGKVNDVSGRVNHITQGTAGAKPLLSAMVNLLLNSQWSGGGSLPTGWSFNSATGTSVVNGTVGSDYIYRFTCTAQRQIFGQVFQIGINESLTISVRVGTIYSGSTNINNVITFVNSPAGATLAFFLNGVPANSSTNVSENSVIAVTVTASNTAGTITARVGFGASANATGSLDLSRPQLEYGTQNTKYQRVSTGTDYDIVGFPTYAKFDGVDDGMTSPTGGGATSGFFFCQAVKPLAQGVLRTLWSDAGANTGIKVQIGAANKLSISAGNGADFTTVASVETAPIGATSLLTAWDDGVNLNVQIGSGAVAQIARPAISSGTVGATVGKDNGAATSYFNGNLYPSIIRSGTPLTTTERATAQAWCKSKAGL